MLCARWVNPSALKPPNAKALKPPHAERELLHRMHSLTRVRPAGDRRSTLDIRAAEVAGRQHGVIARRQLVELGAGVGAIQHRLATGRLHPVFRGVFAVGHLCLTREGRWTAAVLACGEEAFLSHRCAAALWGLAPYSGSRIDVTAPGTHRGRRGELVVHGSLLPKCERTSVDGIAVTSVPRTLLDLAAAVDQGALDRAVESAERLELFDLRALRSLLRRHRGRRGAARLRVALDVFEPDVETRSELERRFVGLCRGAGLPRPAINRRIAGLEIDAVWKEQALAVELDGYAYHRSRRSFEDDRRRDAVLLLAGYRVVRFTARRLNTDPGSVVATLRQLLDSPTRVSQ
jgi:predicted transcriptional regulator of viral defense system